jgi:hypothetical protein
VSQASGVTQGLVTAFAARLAKQGLTIPRLELVLLLFIIKNLILQRLSFNTPRLLISKEPFTL